MPETKTRKFPKGFLWGAATSAYQVEGGIENNNWSAAVPRVPVAGLACDHFRRWPSDFALAKKLNHNAHRLSLEWSRIEPAAGEWDEAAIAHYHEVLSWLKDNGLATFVTLHHFTDPLWISKMGGWKNPETVTRFAGYTSKVCQTLGHLIDFWITVNEPNVYAYMGYIAGKFPPFKRNPLSALLVYRNMLRGHNRAYEMIHAYYPGARAGFAQNIAYHDKPAKLKKWFEVAYPYRRTKSDFLAVNHYFVHSRKKFPGTDRGWPVYPKALYEVLMDLKRFDLPIYITENGLADARDANRAGYIRGYLTAAHRAIGKGADVRGYLHWSLLDNFEWEDGYKWKFGLIAVNFTTQKRTIRPSARYYAEICKLNGFPPARE